MNASLLSLLIVLLWTTAVSLEPNDDPYKILGVSRTAPVNAIKKAYRNLARLTHPDKSDKDPEQTAAEFRRIVDAWEILSDEKSRNQYDRTGRTDGGGGFGGGQNHQRSHQSGTWTFTFRNGRFYRTQHHHQQYRLKDDPKVREAQSRVMHVISSTCHQERNSVPRAGLTLCSLIRANHCRNTGTLLPVYGANWKVGSGSRCTWK